MLPRNAIVDRRAKFSAIAIEATAKVAWWDVSAAALSPARIRLAHIHISRRIEYLHPIRGLPIGVTLHWHLVNVADVGPAVEWVLGHGRWHGSDERDGVGESVAKKHCRGIVPV
jgi:hypothetical protein